MFRQLISYWPNFRFKKLKCKKKFINFFMLFTMLENITKDGQAMYENVRTLKTKLQKAIQQQMKKKPKIPIKKYQMYK